eukprot:TRINITY_DN4215_c0_g1_i1.p1 TRINITY_DN4215_c0_g1~~TRINITY_DN4215_c0_g1_i1.p1  ORF type:complete len:566 (-),score=65.89 TRINITY_DN4215_c0_g1_i1:197-1894(-)
MEESVDLSDCAETEKGPDNGAMLRMVSEETVMTHSSHEVEAARWHTLELMILEERACRMKDVAEIREALARMPDMEVAALGAASTCVKDCSVSAANHTDMKAFSGLLADVRHNFSLRLQELEFKLRDQAERQMILVRSGFENVNRQVAELQGRRRLKDEETVISTIAKPAQEGPVVHQAPTAACFSREKSTLAETARSSKAILLQTPVMQSREPTRSLSPVARALQSSSAMRTPLLSSRGQLSDTLCSTFPAAGDSHSASSSQPAIRTPLLSSGESLKTSRSTMPAVGVSQSDCHPAILSCVVQSREPLKTSRSTMPAAGVSQTACPSASLSPSGQSREPLKTSRSTMPAAGVSQTACHPANLSPAGQSREPLKTSRSTLPAAGVSQTADHPTILSPAGQSREPLKTSRSTFPAAGVSQSVCHQSILSPVLQSREPVNTPCSTYRAAGLKLSTSNTPLLRATIHSASHHAQASSPEMLSRLVRWSSSPSRVQVGKEAILASPAKSSHERTASPDCVRLSPGLFGCTGALASPNKTSQVRVASPGQVRTLRGPVVCSPRHAVATSS